MKTNIILMAKREDPFARVPKSILERTDLSWKAKGVLSYLLGKPAGWKTNVQDVMNRGRDKEHAVRSALKELRKAGFAELVRLKDEKGRNVECVWKISDSPIFCPLGDFPQVDFPQVGNHHHIKNDGTKNQGNKNQSKETKGRPSETATSGEVPAVVFLESSKTDPKNGTRSVPVAVTEDHPPIARPPLPLKAPRKPRAPKIPDRDDFEQFIEDHCPDVAMYRDTLFDDLDARGWIHTDGQPIRNWKQYVMGLENKINHAND